MKCPVCAGNLQTRRVKNQGLDIDQCESCRGIWFDSNELKSVLGHLASTHERIPKGARKRKDAECPRCQQPLLEHSYPGTSVKVHSCATCAGVWLDNTELSAIRSARKDNQQQLVKCPNCQHEQLGGTDCQECGIIFSKFSATQAVSRPVLESEPHGDNPVETLLFHLADSANLKDKTLITRLVGAPASEAERVEKMKLNRNVVIAVIIGIAILIPLGYVDGPNIFRPCEHWAPGSTARCMVYKEGAPWEVYPGYYIFFLTLVGLTGLPFAWQTFYYRRSRWPRIR